MKNKLKIISWNVNGIRSVFKKGFMEFLEVEKPDILCLQEIKIDENQFPKELFSLGYSVIINSADKKGYSGVAIFVKNNTKKNNLKLGNKRFDSEGRFIEINYQDFTLINFYIPQGGRDKSNIPYKIDVYKKIFSYLRKFKNKKVILMGDFNIAHKEIDLARPKNNKNNTMFTNEEREQLDKLTSLGFVDSFRIFNKDGDNYSWWSYLPKFRLKEHVVDIDARKVERRLNVGWRLDYAFVSKAFSKSIKNAYILKEVYGSDHAPIVIEINQEIK